MKLSKNSNGLRMPGHALVLVLALGIAGCATTPEQNRSLEQARDRLAAAQADPQVNALASEELRKAEQTLREAEQAWEGRRDTLTVDHLAYMTSQRVAIAEKTASSRASGQLVERASKERDELRLAVRTSEADRARMELEATRQERARMEQELAAVGAAAAAERDRSAQLEAELAELNARETDRGMVVTLGDVLFETNKHEIVADGAQNLRKLAEFLQRYPDTRASIEGHTDSVGDASYNEALSQRRANSVRDALVSLGVPANSLSTRAHGENQPVASNDNATGRQLNRRVEIIFDAPDEDR